MSFSHTLIRLDRDAPVTLCQSHTRGGPQLNFGEVASIPLTLAQAEEVAAKLRAWIDDHMPTPPSLALVKNDAA